MQKYVARAALVGAALIGSLCLVHFARFISARSLSDGEGAPNSISREELRIINTTKPMIQFAGSIDAASVESNVELARMIEGAGLRKHWIVTITRIWSSDGEIEDRPLFVRPGQHAHRFEPDRELLRILASRSTDASRTVKIAEIPVELLDLEPHEVLPKLQWR